VQSGCAASRQGHVTCRRARGAVSLHLSIICREEKDHEEHVDSHRLVYTASFPNGLGSSDVMFIRYISKRCSVPVNPGVKVEVVLN